MKQTVWKVWPRCTNALGNNAVTSGGRYIDCENGVVYLGGPLEGVASLFPNAKKIERAGIGYVVQPLDSEPESESSS